MLAICFARGLPVFTDVQRQKPQALWCPRLRRITRWSCGVAINKSWEGLSRPRSIPLSAISPEVSTLKPDSLSSRREGSGVARVRQGSPGVATTETQMSLGEFAVETLLESRIFKLCNHDPSVPHPQPCTFTTFPTPPPPPPTTTTPQAAFTYDFLVATAQLQPLNRQPSTRAGGLTAGAAPLRPGNRRWPLTVQTRGR